MKCADSKYISLPSFDQSRYSCDFTEYELTPTKTDYTLVSIGSHPEVFNAYDNIVLLWMELPNCLVHDDTSNLGHYTKVTNNLDKIKKIFTNCPFSVEYFNNYYNTDKFEFAFSPFNSKYILPTDKKIYDVFHTGNVSNSAIADYLPILEKFNSCFVGADYGESMIVNIANTYKSPSYINQITESNAKYYGKMVAKTLISLKYSGVDYLKKLELNSQSKVSIVHGLLKWPENKKYVTKKFIGHKAFELIDKCNYIPQIKSRTLEAAACKSIILSLQDPWNMIESYFEKDKDFIYWTNSDDLEEKIRYILSHYDEFQPMADHAYNTLMNNFTTECFFNQYLKNL